MKINFENVKVSSTNAKTAELTFVVPLGYGLRELLNDTKLLLEKDKKLFIEIKQIKKKRSLDANSYAWVLLSKIADVLRTSKEAVYIEMLKSYGQREPQLILVVQEGVEMIVRATSGHCVEVGESELKGKLFKHLAILIGSSQYSSAEMAILIDGIIFESKLLDIETITENEKSLLLEAMKC